ncbi:MAG: ParA family protein [Pedosphaera sp.]|nr:ParA family protein [Pedosphaera sp.]
MSVNVSFINMKGGVGKTSLAMQTAIYAAWSGKRVLAVDLDPQSNLSQALLGPERYVKVLNAGKSTVVQLLEDYQPAGIGTGGPQPVTIHDVIIKGVWASSRHLHLLPCRLELSRVLRNPAGKERKLAKALAKVASDYDLVIIDCAPTESVLTDIAYFASRWILVPVKPEFLAAIGLPLLARSLEHSTKENDDHHIEMAGIVFNHGDYQPGPEAKASVGEVRKLAKDEGWSIFEHEVPHSKAIPKSAREASAIAHTSYARSGIKNAITGFSSELFQKIGV